jgi:deoxyribodipyrimidine photo-lyase
LPLITIDNTYQHDNLRQLVFLVESIKDLSESYEECGGYLNVLFGNTQEILLQSIQKENIGIIIASASYVKYFRDILIQIAKTKDIPVILLDDNTLLPVNIVSDHEEYAAYTLRKKYWQTVTSLSQENHEPTCNKVHFIKKENILSKILESDWYHRIQQQLTEQSTGIKNQFP